jgi:hypothetical protein
VVSPNEERTFAEVAASTPTAVNAVVSTAAGLKELTSTVANPSKRAKNSLAATRASQRAALLKKRREVAAEKTAATSDAEETAPEDLRGTEGARALNISLSSSPPPPQPNLELTGVCDCSSECTSDGEEDFHNDLIEDGVRLNTSDPHWESVFPCKSGRCRFCRTPCTPDDLGQCEVCRPQSIFQAVKKYAPRWRYPKY